MDIPLFTDFSVLGALSDLHLWISAVSREEAEKLVVGLLPYALVSWIISTFILAAKIVVCMFITFARVLPAPGWLGTNIIKITLGLSAATFAPILAGHFYHANISESHKFSKRN